MFARGAGSPLRNRLGGWTHRCGRSKVQHAVRVGAVYLERGKFHLRRTESPVQINVQ
jgi:hypothetical protein